MSIEEAIGRAYAHWNAGQTDQAEQLCQRVLAAWPGQADALHLMGLMAHAHGNADLALDYVRQSCTAPRAPALYFSNLAEMCRQRGLLDEGEAAARRGTGLDATMPGAWNNLGIILQEMGKLEESAVCLERVAALQPHNPETHNNLANTFMRMGRLDHARTHYDKALSFNPRYAEAHSNLAHLLHELGSDEEAVREAQLAIDLNPRLADAYLNLAEAELARRRGGDALRALDNLLRFAPQHPGALTGRARALKQLDRLGEARESAAAAAALAPRNPDTHNVLGEIQRSLGLVDEAFASFEQAIHLSGASTEQARVNKAVLLMEAGRSQEARALFDAILEDNPRCLSAWANRADMKTFTPGDPDIARLEGLLGPHGPVSFKDRMILQCVLGKVHLDLGNSERAFHHLGEGNRMKRSGFQFDVGATVGWLESIAAAFPPALFGKRRTAGAPSDLPVFVLGMPRSGTTLVEQILASHPAVHGAGELAVMRRLVGGVGDYPAGAAQLDQDGLARLGEAYLAQVRPLAAGRSRVVDKMPANFLHAGLIHLALPNARIVHCRRDPVDTCLSCYTKLFEAEQPFAYDLAELGRFHRGYQALMAHWRAVLPADRFIEVDYEAVVEDLEGEARRLIDFLGLPWDESCLEFHRTARPVRTASVNQVRQPIYKSSTGRWKRHAGQLGPLLEALGVTADAAAAGAGTAVAPAKVKVRRAAGSRRIASREAVVPEAGQAAAESSQPAHPVPAPDLQALERQARTLLDTQRFEEAEGLLRPHLPAGAGPIPLWQLLSVALHRQGRIAEARTVQETLVQARPSDLAGRFDLAESALLLGDFELGWKEYHWRYSLPHTVRIERKVQWPRWDGQPIPGKTLLIHDEQGYGDTFQFMRMVAWARERSQARVVLEINAETLSLAKRMGGFDETVVRGALPPACDVHCEMMSLPMAMGLTMADLPGRIPYLSASPSRLTRWRKRLAKLPRPLVALVWAGRPTHPNDANRSLSLAQLAPLALPGITFLAVQKGPKAAEATAAPPGMTILSLDGEIQDFEDTAAILSVADLLISVDSSPVHLAGALGRPAWVMLPFVPDWRWLMEREDTPWYPSLRLFRQEHRGDWDGVACRIGAALAALRDGGKA